MKKFAMTLITAIIVCFGVCQVFADTWTDKASFPGLWRQDGVGFSIGAKGYFGTGVIWGGDGEGSAQFFIDFWEYDPATDAWTQKVDFIGGERVNAVGFSIGTKGYIGLGYSDGHPQDVYEYDPGGNTWKKVADFPGTGREKAAAFSIAGKGYVGTGQCDEGGPFFVYKNDLWEYNPALDSWRQVASFGDGEAEDGRYIAVGFSIGNKGYIGTGINDSDYFKDFWEYDPAIGELGAWTKKTDFGGSARQAAVGFSINGKGYIGAGYTGSPTNAPLKDFWAYDPSANTWTQIEDLVGPTRMSAVGFSIDNKGYVGLGYDATYMAPDPQLRDLWEYGSSCVSKPVKVGDDGTALYDFIQDAYEDIMSAETIRAHAVSITENLHFGDNKIINLMGGYDCSFAAQTGFTTVSGYFKISRGTVKISRLILK
jgi:N-acetylneuraminic acid mutarotase